MITLSIPAALDLSMMVLRAGMRTSQPSRPKRFSDDHFLARKSSNLDIITVHIQNLMMFIALAGS